MRQKTITLWKLCELVEEKLRTEPQNYCQFYYTTTPSERADRGLPALRRRDCGTAYCILGWMGQITGKGHHYAERVLLADAVGYGAASDLSHADALGRKVDRIQVGSREYAEAGIKHLREWMTEHEELLKENYVTIGGGRS